ncbi:uncharacterized protein LOC126372881 [Pectinophora gossypiella]|uniref:uncharacterized protein LOC126372881 n=1 Tax=Pectinophora gossypiella TaxID=13191 RepID=UPI00214E0E39|nr:uncharacterized protein LOC126372881 [Pectinophora gossypiella]
MEWCTTESGKYKIESLSAVTLPGALTIIKEAFCQDEAVSTGAEVNKNPVAAEELLELCADAALDGVSLVAVEKNSGEVAAVAFNKIQVASTDPSEKPFFEIFAEERCTQESSRSLINFMADVDGRCNLFEKYGVDCSLEIMFLATSRDHRRQKLGYILSKTSIDLAKKLKNGPVSKITLQDLGPKYSSMKPRPVSDKIPKICQAIWTAEISQRIGKALNFTVHLTVPMKEFVFNGKTYADRLGDQNAFIEVAALALDA